MFKNKGMERQKRRVSRLNWSELFVNNANRESDRTTVGTAVPPGEHLRWPTLFGSVKMLAALPFPDSSTLSC